MLSPAGVQVLCTNSMFLIFSLTFCFMKFRKIAQVGRPTRNQHVRPLPGVANGADDDASGVTAVILLAKYFQQHRPERSVIFVTFTGEEMGGFGSRYFSKQLDFIP